MAGCRLIIAAGVILRLAGFGFARHKAAMGAFCLVATALMIHELPNFWTGELYPVCEYDLVRYSGSVSEATRCFPEQVLIVGGAYWALWRFRRTAAQAKGPASAVAARD